VSCRRWDFGSFAHPLLLTIQSLNPCVEKRSIVCQYVCGLPIVLVSRLTHTFGRKRTNSVENFLIADQCIRKIHRRGRLLSVRRSHNFVKEKDNEETKSTARLQ